MNKNRSFLKWAGSKYNCLSELLSSLPAGHRLIEPFTGSGVVFMNTNYSSYLLAESNADLIQMYTILYEQGQDFINFCKQYFQPELNCKEKYYEIRTKFNQLNVVDKETACQKSAFFLYLNRHGYNGLCRYNSKGLYNVPFGLYSKPYFPQKEMFLFHQKSKKALFIQNDFRATFQLATAGDIVYCDPPYVPISDNKRVFPYTQNNFSEEDQIELAQLALETAAKGIPVIISNHDTEFTRHHYQKANIKSFLVSRVINCKVTERNPVKELIAIF